MARNKVYAVFGLGTFGRELCSSLIAKGSRVIAVDRNPEPVERIKDTVTQAALLDSTDEESFRSIPIGEVDAAIVAIGDNIESSILTTSVLKQQNVPFIIARAVSDLHARVLEKVGADRVINIEEEQGRRVAQELLAPTILETVALSGSVSMSEVEVPKTFIGKTLIQLDLRKNFHVTLVAIRRMKYTVDPLGNPVSEEVIVFPDRDEAFLEGDVLFAVGLNSDIERLNEY